MNKFVVPIACMALSASAFASIVDIKASNNQLGIQAISTHVDYTENGGSYGTNGGTLDTENGNVPGYALSFSSMRNVIFGNDYFELQYSHNTGNTSYEGSYINSQLPYGSLSGTSDAALTDYSARYGKGFAIKKQVMVTPYVEIGHHEWDRDLMDGNNETYTHKYAGVGAMLQYSPVKKLVFTGNVFAGETFGANISSTSAHFTSASLGSSSIGRIGISVDYAFSKKLHGNAGYDYTTFKYGVSAVNSGGYFEPNSTTNYSSCKIGLGYSF